MRIMLHAAAPPVAGAPARRRRRGGGGDAGGRRNIRVGGGPGDGHVAAHTAAHRAGARRRRRQGCSARGRAVGAGRAAGADRLCRRNQHGRAGGWHLCVGPDGGRSRYGNPADLVQEAIAFRASANQPMRRKLAGGIYSNGFEFGVRDGGSPRRAGSSTRRTSSRPSGCWSPGAWRTDFDRLPIPFRAIATDMQTGEMVVLASGDLPHALRASMSVRACSRRSRSTGGCWRRRPEAQLAGRHRARRPAPTSSSPYRCRPRSRPPMSCSRRSPWSLERSRCWWAPTSASSSRSSPPTTCRSSSTWEISRPARSTVRRTQSRSGARPPRASRPAVTTVRRRGGIRCLARRDQSRQRESVQLADVRVHGLERVEERYVLEHLGLESGSVVDQRQLSAHISRLFSLGEFERAEFALGAMPRSRPWTCT